MFRSWPKYQISMTFIQTLITGLTYALVVYFGAHLVLAGQGFSAGMLFAFLSFRQTFNDRATGFIGQLVQFRLMGLHLNRLADIITTAPEATFVRTSNLGIKGAIKVRDLAFRYGAADHVLRDVGLDVSAGDFVAIMGSSGAGKTTLLKLLLGLYHPISGTIQLDGHLTDPELWRA
jgi:ATP-binding cassette subfamily B protein RaxB